MKRKHIKTITIAKIENAKRRDILKLEKMTKAIRALNIRIPGNDAVKFIHENR